jgi:hypothetical protein
MIKQPTICSIMSRKQGQKLNKNIACTCRLIFITPSTFHMESMAHTIFRSECRGLAVVSLIHLLVTSSMTCHSQDIYILVLLPGFQKGRDIKASYRKRAGSSFGQKRAI